MTKCKACSNDIAMDARTCPKCGKQNDYLHPEIERFLKNKDSIATPAIRFQYQSNTITFGIYSRSLWRPDKNLGRAAALCVALFVLSAIKWRAFAYPLIVLELLFQGSAGVTFIYCGIGCRISSNVYHLISSDSVPVDFPQCVPPDFRGMCTS